MSTVISIPVENTKLGPIPSFSLLGGVTCPGKTRWCWEQDYCYNIAIRARWKKVEPALLRNMDVARNIPKLDYHLRCFFDKTKRPEFRIHVDGDYDRVKYIRMWATIIKDYPHIAFGSYTRSWTVSRLVDALEHLRECPNIQLFDSIDETTEYEPIPTHRKAWIQGTPGEQGILCPELLGRVKNCTKCLYCYRHTQGDVIFPNHSIRAKGKRGRKHYAYGEE